MTLIDREAALKILHKNPMGTWRGTPVYSAEIKAAIQGIEDLPTIDPIRAAGGCRCGECKKYMTPKCLLCSFDVDGSCTGGPESDFYCGDSEPREAKDDG